MSPKFDTGEYMYFFENECYSKKKEHKKTQQRLQVAEKSQIMYVGSQYLKGNNSLQVTL